MVEGIGGGESSRGISSGRSEEVLRDERRVSGVLYTRREARTEDSSWIGLDWIGSWAWTPRLTHALE